MPWETKLSFKPIGNHQTCDLLVKCKKGKGKGKERHVL